ncbi:MAG: ATP-binding protein, partial [Rhodoferax sp.]
NGMQVLSSVKRIPAADWYMVATVPTAEAFAPIQAMQERKLLAAAFLSLLVVMLTWWMLRHQLTPLTQTAKVLAHWDSAKSIMPTLTITRKDEIGDLVGGFNAMLQKLAQREESLHTHQIELKAQNEELIRSETELSEARSRYFDLYNMAPVGYCTVNEKGLILDVNLTGSSMLGLPRCKLVGMAFYRLVLQEERPIYHLHSTALLTSRLPQECELRLTLPDGVSLWVHLMSSVEQEGQGASVLRVVISDITARKKTELALHETHVELEKLVNYTKLYQNERLVALGVMAGGIAHELRNPLSVCFSAAQFLRDQPGDPAEQQECTQKIIEGIEKSSAIIDNLLRFARPPLDDEMKPTNLVSVLHESVKSVTAQARLQRISLLEDYEEANVPILGNAILLQQVLMNLFLNACQAMPTGGEIRTAVRRSAREAVLWVRDTGEGIAPENVSRLFDPVFTTRPEGQGNGLGLPICRLIVQRHGGTITVESVLGEGSTFTIRLPLLAGGLVAPRLHDV